MKVLGLIDEVDSIYCEAYNKFKGDIFSKGIFQSIGFKEFIPYLKIKCNELSLGETNPEIILQDCFEVLNNHTKQYTASQISFIRHHLLRLTSKPIYRIDTSRIDSVLPETTDNPITISNPNSYWNIDVLNPVYYIVDNFLQNNPINITGHETVIIVMPKQNPDTISNWKKFVCTSCNKTLNGWNEWNIHIKSRGHRKKKKTKRQ